MSRRGYMVVYTEPVSKPGFFVLPSPEESPRKIYTSFEAAKKALLECIQQFPVSTPIQYGEAFPFDSYSFESHLSKKGFAMLSIVERPAELPFEEDFRVGAALIMMDIA